MCENAGVPQQYQAGGPVDTGFTGSAVIGGREYAVPTKGDKVPGLSLTAQGLMAAPLNLPGQQVAGFSPAQLQAFGLAEQGVGSYKPYLERATGLTEEGVAALQQSLGATRDLAGQIPGQIAPGQAALASAATGVESAAGRGE